MGEVRRLRKGKTIEENERHFSYENISFDYTLILEKRKTISISVFPAKTIVVKAPAKASPDQIHDFLRRRIRWILKQQRYFAQFKPLPEKTYVSGETFRYRGRSYKLLVRKSNNREYVSLQYGVLNVFTSTPEERNHTKTLLEEWFRIKAHKVFYERLSVCFSLFNFTDMPGLMVRPMKRRWGSYSHRTNRVILNLELIKARTRYIDYVIIHELCHIVHRKHDRNFYDLLASKVPNWKTLKTELELSLLS